MQQIQLIEHAELGHTRGQIVVRLADGDLELMLLGVVHEGAAEHIDVVPILIEAGAGRVQGDEAAAAAHIAEQALLAFGGEGIVLVAGVEDDCGVVAGPQVAQRVEVVGEVGLIAAILGQDLLEELVLRRRGVVGRAAPHIKDLFLCLVAHGRGIVWAEVRWRKWGVVYGSARFNLNIQTPSCFFSKMLWSMR